MTDHLDHVSNNDCRTAVATLTHWCTGDLAAVQHVLGDAVDTGRLLPVTLALLQVIRGLYPELGADENLATLRRLAAGLTGPESE